LRLLLSVKILCKFIFILLHIQYEHFSYRYKIGKCHISFEHLFYNISVTNLGVKSPHVDVTFVQTQTGCYLPTLTLTLCFLPLWQVVFCLCLLMSETALAKGFVNVTKSQKFTVYTYHHPRSKQHVAFHKVCTAQIRFGSYQREGIGLLEYQYGFSSHGKVSSKKTQVVKPLNFAIILPLGNKSSGKERLGDYTVKKG
jgi:hypothetical protein